MIFNSCSYMINVIDFQSSSKTCFPFASNLFFFWSVFVNLLEGGSALCTFNLAIIMLFMCKVCRTGKKGLFTFEPGEKIVYWMLSQAQGRCIFFVVPMPQITFLCHVFANTLLLSCSLVRIYADACIFA